MTDNDWRNAMIEEARDAMITHYVSSPQGEPSSEMLAVALSELRKADYWAWKAMSPRGMRAALRAALTVGEVQ